MVWSHDHHMYIHKLKTRTCSDMTHEICQKNERFKLLFDTVAAASRVLSVKLIQPYIHVVIYSASE